MELFTAGDESQLDTIKRWIDSSDIYMLILGTRYGSIEPKTGLSYVEIEYDYAVTKKIPIFAVVIKDASSAEKTTALNRKQALFRDKVLKKMCSFFDDTKDIQLAVHRSIPAIQDKSKLNGWVLASEVPDTKKVIEEIVRLQGHNTSLIKENDNLNKKLKQFSEKPNPEKEYESLENVLDKIDIKTKSLNKSGKIETYTLFHILLRAKNYLVTGVTNKRGIGPTENFLYFDICPRLQIHGLVINEKISSVQWRRFCLTSKGADFLAFIERKTTVSKSDK